MNKEQLKNILRPIIKDIISEEIKKINISEMIIKSGIITEVVSQCLGGIESTLLSETKPKKKNEFVIDVHEIEQQKKVTKNYADTAKKLSEITGLHTEMFGINKNMEQKINSMPQSPKVLKEASKEVLAKTSALQRNNIHPDDPGININNIISVAGGLNVWKKQAFGNKKRK